MDFMQSGSAVGNFLSWFGKKNNYGEIFGNSVTPEQVMEKAGRDMIVTDLLYNIGLNSFLSAKQAEVNAFSNLSLLAAARKRGIDASNKEIADFISARPKFRDAKTGKFDDKLYSAYIDGILKINGFAAADLDLAVREYLIIAKLRDELQDGVIVTDNEIDNFYQLLNEKYYVSTCAYQQARFLKKVRATPEEAEAFFNAGTEKPEEYIPGKINILLVEFKYDAPEFKKMAEAEITAEIIEEFYHKNKNLFMKTQTGKKPVLLPLAEAGEKARQLLKQRYAKKFANAQAAKFADAVYDLVGDSEKSEQRRIFEDAVRKFNCKAVETGYFQDNVQSIGKIAEPALIREVVSLNEVPVSTAITGQEAAYVAFIVNRVMPRPAKFEEVKDKVIAKLKERKALEMARSQARELAAKLQKLDKSERLKFITGDREPKFKILEPFSRISPPRILYGNVILGMANDLKSGEVAPVKNVPDGALIAVLRKRVLPAMSGLNKQKKAELSDIYRRQKTAVAEAAFSFWLQSKCKVYKQN